MLRTCRLTNLSSILRSRLLFAAIVVGLCCVGQATCAQAGDGGATALPPFVPWVGDFDGMQQRRLIRLIVRYSKTIFFIDKGEPLGTAAEWGSELDGWLNKGKKSELEHRNMRRDVYPAQRRN